MGIHEILKKYWGFDSFRPLQKEIIESVLEGKDTLGLMPTGGGKSLTFQVPGLTFPDGLTIVVSPLISLMKDQVDNLKTRRISAVAIHSGLTTKELRIAWEKITKGRARFLYVSPEKLQNERFIGEIRNLKVNFIVVDEAHCISQWGYDFRPHYLNIKRLRKIKPNVPILALTATATSEVIDDIMRQLEFKTPCVFKKSFARPNISYVVRNSDTKPFDILHILTRTTGSAIIYVRNRKKTQDIADFLNNAGISTTYYHAGIDNDKKVENQNLWKEGKVRAIVATNAFGMGIDKADVRVVVHYDLPSSLEEYYQEAGRVGRDGLPSYAVVLISKTESATLHKRLTEAFPPRQVIKKTYEDVCVNLHLSIGEGYNCVKEFNIGRFCDLFHYQEKQCRSSLRILSQAGYLHFMEDYDKRSRMMVVCEREDLYHINGISTNAEAVMTATLRLYTGIFSDFQYINEYEIQKLTKLSPNQVYESLLELDKAKIINYIPRSGLPLIHVPTAREETKCLVIGKDIYENRKEQMSERIESVIDFAFNNTTCRVKRMLRYFGENNANDCGKCDVCRSRKNNPAKEKESVKEIVENILSYLKNHPEGARLISLESQCGANKKLISSSISHLCNEGFVQFKENLYFLA